MTGRPDVQHGSVFEEGREQTLGGVVCQLTPHAGQLAMGVLRFAHDTLKSAGQRLLDDRMFNVVLCAWSGADGAVCISSDR